MTRTHRKFVFTWVIYFSLSRDLLIYEFIFILKLQIFFQIIKIETFSVRMVS